MAKAASNNIQYNSVGIDISTIPVDAMSYVIPEIKTPTTTLTLDGTEVITESSVLDVFAVVYIKSGSNKPRGVTSGELSLGLELNPGIVFTALRILMEKGYVDEGCVDGMYLYTPGSKSDELMYKSLVVKDNDMGRRILIGFKNGETVVVSADTITTQ